MRFTIGSLLALMLVMGCADSPQQNSTTDSVSPSLEDVSPAPPTENAEELAEIKESEQKSPEAVINQDGQNEMAKESISENSTPKVSKADDQPAETLTENSKQSEKPQPLENNAKTAQAETDDDKPNTTTDIASIDMSTLTAEQRFAVLRAQAMGQPIPTFGKGPPKEIKLLVPDKDFVRDPQHDALRVTFDDIDLLKTLNMEPVPLDALEYFPEWLKNLDGKRIILRGWMFPAGRDDGISTFMFVRDSGLCCFGSNPKIYDKLAVTMREGVTTKYIEGRPFDVVATLRIDPEILDDEWWWLFHLDDALVIDK